MPEYTTYRLPVYQIADYLPLIESAIQNSYRSATQEAARLMELLSQGGAQVWAVLEKDEGIPAVLAALAVTTIRSGVLEVRALESYTRLSMAAWKAAWQVVAAYALSEKCKRVRAITRNPRVLQIAEALDWDTSWVICEGEIHG